MQIQSHLNKTGVWILAIGVITAGCAFLPHGSDADEGPQPANFRTTAAVNNNSMSLPVEIADDIARISEGGQIERVPGSTEAPAPAAGAASQEETADGAAAGEETDAAGETITGKIATGGGKKRNQKYVVKRGDTLMKIAYNKLGDLLRWKEIYQTNKSSISGFNRLRVGQTLFIKGVEYVVIEKNGKPYLIRRHDTLAKISTQVYGTPAGWPRIWKNNPRMIKNPNKIYAGFTLYYPSLTDVSSPNMRQPSSLSRLARFNSANPSKSGAAPRLKKLSRRTSVKR